MNSQQLLYINLGIGLFFVLYFLFFRTKPKQPTRLNLRAKSSTDTEPAQDQALQQERQAKLAQVLQVKPTRPDPEPPLESAVPPSPPKQFGIYFVYNAHEWESYQVLGLTPGCSLQQATEKYQQLIKVSDPSTFEFYGAAFDAILKRRSGK